MLINWYKEVNSSAPKSSKTRKNQQFYNFKRTKDKITNKTMNQYTLAPQVTHKNIITNKKMKLLMNWFSSIKRPPMVTNSVKRFCKSPPNQFRVFCQDCYSAIKKSLLMFRTSEINMNNLKIQAKLARSLSTIKDLPQKSCRFDLQIQGKKRPVTDPETTTKKRQSNK